MSRLAGFSGRDLATLARQMGWSHVRTRGDHMVFRHPDSPLGLTIPNHRELKPGTLRSILRTLGIDVADFLERVRR